MPSCHQHLQFPRNVRLFDIFVICARHSSCRISWLLFPLSRLRFDYGLATHIHYTSLSDGTSDKLFRLLRLIPFVWQMCPEYLVMRLLCERWKVIRIYYIHFVVCKRIGENCCAPLRSAPNVSTQYALCGVTEANSFRHRTIPSAWIRLLNWNGLFDENKARKNQFQKKFERVLRLFVSNNHWIVSFGLWHS